MYTCIIYMYMYVYICTIFRDQLHFIPPHLLKKSPYKICSLTSRGGRYIASEKKRKKGKEKKEKKRKREKRAVVTHCDTLQQIAILVGKREHKSFEL